MGCAASKLDIEADKSMLSRLRPIHIKKSQRRRLRRFSTFSTTTELLQSEESETTGDTSTSGKFKASAVAPEPIAEDETEDSDREVTKREELEMKKIPQEKKEDPKDMIEDLKEEIEVSKEKLEERKQRTEEMSKNGEQPKEEKEERCQIVTEELKENREESEEEIEVKSPRKTEESAKEREEPKQEKEESIQCRTEEKNEKRTEELKVKEEDVSRKMLTEERKESNEEADMKNTDPMEKIEAENDPNLTSKRIEVEEEFVGSPSFRFYCRDIQSFDSDDSVILSGFQRSTAERLEEIKQHNEPIEEVGESQASSKSSQCYSPRKRRGRRLLKLKAPNAVRSLFTCYSSGNGCSNPSPGSNRYSNRRLVGKTSVIN